MFFLFIIFVYFEIFVVSRSLRPRAYSLCALARLPRYVLRERSWWKRFWSIPQQAAPRCCD